MLHIHRAERADALADALRDVLARPLDDPFTPEVVVVPTRGMERWLTQRMSGALGAGEGRGDGICANVAFPFPRVLVEDAIARASGIDPETDPWRPERAVWPLLEVVGACREEPWLRDLAQHLEGGASRRFAAVRHIAELYDRYALNRPEMVRGWAAGEGDHWQAELWRRLRARLAVASPAERLESACPRLAAEPGLLDLPPRVSLFGLTRLPAGHLAVLRALAAGRDLHLFLLHPSPAHWAHGDDARNRLLASWGRDAREMQAVLGGTERVEHHHPVAEPPATLLGRLQAAVRDDAGPQPGPADGSIEIHACHGRARQVEVMRDAILHLLAEDETLQPRDVIVMCPDIETFAPLIQATFGAGETVVEEGIPDVRPHDLRVRLADRSLRQTNPVLGVVAQLIDLAGRRITASEVLDLADRDPVRRRFRLEDEDVARIRDWVATSGIRWGLDAAHRAPFKLHDLASGTWRAGLDRLLVGVTMTEEDHRLFGGVLPVDDVESMSIDLVGRLAELVDRLQEAVDAFSVPKPIEAWAAAIAGAADALTATSARDAWQRTQLQRILDQVVAEAAAAEGTELALPEIRALMAERLQGRPTRANFRTGHLTICTLVPMRSVPHRVVCLLGLDDGAFPRKAPRDGDDLMLAERRPGERDPRAEDRQMLLDALMAAGERLVITYTGNDVRTNAPRPPAVPVGELLDQIELIAGQEGRERVLVRHPLQPFDSANFAPGRLVPGRTWSFDAAMLAGAAAAGEARAEPPPFLPAALPPLERDVIELEDLVAFVRHPVRAFLRQRLGISVGLYADEVDDALPVELDKLQEWQIGERLLQARLAGATPEAAAAAERARGDLPPGKLSDPVLEQLLEAVEPIAAAARGLLPGAATPGSADVRVTLPDGRRLSGTVPDVCGTLLRTVTYSRVNARHRLTAWVRFLALTASHPGRPYEAAIVGREGDAVAVRSFARLTPAVALEHLTALVALHEEGLRRPLPIACKTSAAFAAALHGGGDADRAAEKEWKTEYLYPREDEEPEHRLVFGRTLTFAELRAQDGFDRYAMRLWAALLGWEEAR